MADKPAPSLPSRHLDIYLLRCFQALVSEAHVTHAAEKMGIGQPAMSTTLARLRLLFADPILVRTEKGMVATPRAMEALRQVSHALELIDQTLTEGTLFDPLTAKVSFRISASESVGFLLVPRLISLLRLSAPGVNLEFQTPELPVVRQELESGDTDLVVAFLRDPPQGLRSMSLMSQRLCVIAAGNHPDIQGQLSMAQYLRFPHAVYALGRKGGSTIEKMVDDALAEAGLTRTIGATLTSTLASTSVVARSDLLATIPERIALDFAPSLGLQILPPPLALGHVDTAMFWHNRMHNNSAHRWLRQQLKAVAESLNAA